MAQLPIVQNLHEEFVLYVATVDTEQTMDQICDGASTASIAFEKNRRAGKTLRVRQVGSDQPFPRDMTVSEAGITPMASLEFYYED